MAKISQYSYLLTVPEFWTLAALNLPRNFAWLCSKGYLLVSKSQYWAYYISLILTKIPVLAPVERTLIFHIECTKLELLLSEENTTMNI